MSKRNSNEKPEIDIEHHLPPAFKLLVEFVCKRGNAERRVEVPKEGATQKRPENQLCASSARPAKRRSSKHETIEISTP